MIENSNNVQNHSSFNNEMDDDDDDNNTDNSKNSNNRLKKKGNNRKRSQSDEAYTASKSKASGGTHRRFGSGLFGSKKKNSKGDNSDNNSKVKNKNISIDSLPKPLPTTDVYGRLVHWTLIDGNLNKSAVGHTLQIWIQRDPNADPIIDIVIVNQVKYNKCYIYV